MQTAPWLLATYIPLAVVYTVLVWKMIAAISRSILAGNAVLFTMTIVVAALLSSGMGVLTGQIWAIIIEIIRVGDGHLGSRTQSIPYMHLEGRTFAVGVLLFLAAVAVQRRSRSLSTT